MIGIGCLVLVLLIVPEVVIYILDHWKEGKK